MIGIYLLSYSYYILGVPSLGLPLKSLYVPYKSEAEKVILGVLCLENLEYSYKGPIPWKSENPYKGS